MKDEERDKLLFEVHQGFFGVPDSDDRGLVGDVKKMNEHLKEQNASILKSTIQGQSNKTAISYMKWIVGGLVVIIITIVSVLAS